MADNPGYILPKMSGYNRALSGSFTLTRMSS